MDLSLLKALSEADAIASSEQEVRQILQEEADRLQKEVRFDGLGSVLIRLNESTGHEGDDLCAYGRSGIYGAQHLPRRGD